MNLEEFKALPENLQEYYFKLLSEDELCKNCYPPKEKEVYSYEDYEILIKQNCNKWVKDQYLYRYVTSTGPLQDEKLNYEFEKIIQKFLENNCSGYVGTHFKMTKKLVEDFMRQVKISAEHYLNNVEVFAPYYKILCKNNPDIKQDGVKCINLITDSLNLEEIKNKSNVSALKYIQSQDPCYYEEYWYNFNWALIQNKYPEQLKKVIDCFIDNISENYFNTIKGHHNRVDLINDLSFYSYCNNGQEIHDYRIKERSSLETVKRMKMGYQYANASRISCFGHDINFVYYDHWKKYLKDIIPSKYMMMNAQILNVLQRNIENFLKSHKESSAAKTIKDLYKKSLEYIYKADLNNPLTSAGFGNTCYILFTWIKSCEDTTNLSNLYDYYVNLLMKDYGYDKEEDK